MGGSIFGKVFRISTWGESHGAGVGVVIDGCPAGLSLCEEDIQKALNRRRPGQSKFTTARSEADRARILSGVFEGRTTGTPISVLVMNEDQRSRDYEQIKSSYRPGHADYTFDMKYGLRDYRGGGRSSGRETIARVAAGAVAGLILEELGIKTLAYAKSIGPVEADMSRFDESQINENPFFMPDAVAAEAAAEYVTKVSGSLDSCGGIIEVVSTGLPAGLGETVFDKLDALIGQAFLSIGAVKGVEIGRGFGVAETTGSVNNDPFYMDGGRVRKKKNDAGGVLGGMSDGDSLVIRAAVKPTSSIAMEQDTVTVSGENTKISVQGRHDPVIVPRAVVVAEAMTNLVLCDLLLCNMTSRLDYIKKIYDKQVK